MENKIDLICQHTMDGAVIPLRIIYSYYSYEYENTKVTCGKCGEGTYEPTGNPDAKIHHWFKCNNCGSHIEFVPNVTVE